MPELNPNFKINLHEIFTDKFTSGEIVSQYEVVRIDTPQNIIFLRNVATNQVTKHSSEQIEIYYSKQSHYPQT